MSFIITVVYFIIAIGIIALVHELGHFITAKKAGIGVKEFAIGFGPKLFGFKKDETEYNIRLLPIAGYVDLMGMDQEEDPPPPPDKAFYAKSPKIRFIVLFAGAFMNILLAFFIYFFVFVFTGVPETLPPVIGSLEKGKAAAKSGLLPGDKILAINGKKVKNFIDIALTVSINPGKKLKFSILRNKKLLTVEVVPSAHPRNPNIGYIGARPGYIPPVLGEIAKGGPADIGGLKKNDVVLKINDKKIYSWDDIVEIVSKSPKQKLKFLIKRKGQEKVVYVVPVCPPDKEKVFAKFGIKTKSRTRAFIGVKAIDVPIKRQKLGIFACFKQAIFQVENISIDMIKSLYYLISGKIPGGFKNAMGPVGIASYTGKKAKQGFAAFLEWVALLSTYIGLFNLIPFPALDGGRLFFIFIEACLGIFIVTKDGKLKLNPKVEENFHFLGFILLLMLIVFVTYNDILRVVSSPN